MTGGQDRAAGLRRVILATSVRSARFREAMASTQTPCLTAGALQHAPRRVLRGRAAARIGALIPNPLVSTNAGAPVRLDAVLHGQAAVLTAGQPGADLLALCRRHRLLVVRVAADPAPGVAELAGTPGHAPDPGQPAERNYAEVSPVGSHGIAALQALIRDPDMAVLVRPDRVVARGRQRAPASPPALEHPGRRGYRSQRGFPVAVATGMVSLLTGALIAHRKAGDAARDAEAAPLALAITIADRWPKPPARQARDRAAKWLHPQSAWLALHTPVRPSNGRSGVVGPNHSGALTPA